MEVVAEEAGDCRIVCHVVCFGDSKKRCLIERGVVGWAKTRRKSRKASLLVIVEIVTVWKRQL